MALEEYKRKRNFAQTPEPPPQVEKQGRQRFVVQKHRATQLHYDFRLEMEGVLKSWAVPKGPSLSPGDKRLAMQVEDHPVSYFDFEGIIPPGNYGAGTVMVWDVGTWEALPPQPAQKRGSPRAPDDIQKSAAEMMRKGDFKFRLHGQKLRGEFVLARMRSRRPGSKGTEWLLIKKRDQHALEQYDIDELDYSVLSNRSLREIAGDENAAEWQSHKKATRSKKVAWLQDAITQADKKKPAAKETGARAKKTASGVRARTSPAATKKSAAGDPLIATIEKLHGVVKGSMPRAIRPMLATLVDKPFDDDDWLFEIKWDGYRAIAYLEDGAVRLVSRNQNQFHDYPELRDLPDYVKVRKAILDGEIVALDDQGRPSFSLMQQRAGLSFDGRRRAKRTDVPIMYYAFDLLYAEGYNLMRVDLEERKKLLEGTVQNSEIMRYSEHFVGQGTAVFKAAAEKNLEGIIAKRRKSCYLQKRSREWLKIKITQTQECVIGGYTDPRGSREHFGSLILGLHDKRGRLIPVGQAGSGFTEETHAAMWERLKKLETNKSPFAMKPVSDRRIHFVRPELVAEIKFTEWTHESGDGGLKMRAPVYLGLREDKKPAECVFVQPKSALEEAAKAEGGDA
jgi:bifunctional non-homologous end joining protein LigD